MHSSGIAGFSPASTDQEHGPDRTYEVEVRVKMKTRKDGAGHEP